MTVDGGPAWDDPETNGAGKRSHRIGLIWLVLGLGALVLFCVIVTTGADHAEDLEANGTRATGTVVKDPRHTVTCAQVAVPLRFDVEGRSEVHSFYVEGCTGGGLYKGKKVVVYFDPKDPSDLTVEGDTNDAPLPTYVAIVSLVASMVGISAWWGRAFRLHRTKRVLKAAPWRDARVTMALMGANSKHPTAAVQEDGVDPPVTLVGPAGPAGSTGSTGSGLHRQVAGPHHGRVVLAPARKGPFQVARPLRTSFGRRRAESAIARERG